MGGGIIPTLMAPTLARHGWSSPAFSQGTSMQRSPSLVLSSLVLALCAGSAMAADGKISSLGKANPKAPILSKSELKACLAQQAKLKQTAADLDQRVQAVNAEGDDMAKRRDALKVETDAFQKQNDAIKDFNARQTAFAERAKQWNADKKAFDEQEMSGSERKSKARDLQTRLDELHKDEAALNTEGQALSASTQNGGATLQSHQVAFNDALDAWKTKQSALEKERDAYELDREEWQQTCGNRRFREDDETALKAGK